MTGTMLYTQLNDLLEFRFLKGFPCNNCSKLGWPLQKFCYPKSSKIEFSEILGVIFFISSVSIWIRKLTLRNTMYNTSLTSLVNLKHMGPSVLQWTLHIAQDAIESGMQ